MSAGKKRLWRDIKRNKSCYFMLAPFMILFIVFTIVPVVMSLPMGFTDFNMVQTPKFVGLSNYINLFLSDKIFIRSIRVTIIFALVTGPVSYVLCFLLAWLINELPSRLRTVFTLIFYVPSMGKRIYRLAVDIQRRYLRLSKFHTYRYRNHKSTNTMADGFKLCAGSNYSRADVDKSRRRISCAQGRFPERRPFNVRSRSY